MSRDIKFRAWDSAHEEMIEDAKPHLETDKHVMQFTGLSDKNGKEIYEGDILSAPSWWWGPRYVYLNQGQCGPCKGDSVMSYLLAKNIDNPIEGATHNIWNGKEVEVIGNIYENPDLIK